MNDRTPPPSPNPVDFLAVDSPVSEHERDIRDVVQACVADRVLPDASVVPCKYGSSAVSVGRSAWQGGRAAPKAGPS